MFRQGLSRTKAMNDFSPLTIGNAYHIRDERPNGFIGIAILREINPANYPEGSFKFKLLDGPDGIDAGVFSREHIGGIAQRQDSLSDQLCDLHRYSVQLGMYDAADWLKANFKGL